MKIVICSHNKGKLREFKDIFNELNINNIEFLTLDDFDKIEEPIEDSDTFLGNAIIKAKYYYDKVKLPVICDDTGLCCIGLNLEPGVYSARYKTFDNPNGFSSKDKVLYKLKDIDNKDAYFECDLVFYDGNSLINSKGIVQGKISPIKLGDNGFGYDPIFIPNGYNKTFSELEEKEKNKISHRYKAIIDLVDKLKGTIIE